MECRWICCKPIQRVYGRNDASSAGFENRPERKEKGGVPGVGRQEKVRVRWSDMVRPRKEEK